MSKTQTTLYLDIDLHKELKEEAKVKFFKVNALIISILSEHLSIERLRKRESEITREA